MRIASVAEIKANLSSYLKASASGPVVVTRNGKAVAVLLGVDDDDDPFDSGLHFRQAFRAFLCPRKGLSP